MQNGSASVPGHDADSPPPPATEPPAIEPSAGELPSIELPLIELPSGEPELAEPELAEPVPAEPVLDLRASLEAILLVADEPVPENVIAQVVERPAGEVSAALRELAAAYTAEGRGFDLCEIAGGWRFYTRAQYAGVVERFVQDGQEVRLTQAALETLSVVAYRQPVNRARVSAVRGVNCDGGLINARNDAGVATRVRQATLARSNGCKSRPGKA